MPATDNWDHVLDETLAIDATPLIEHTALLVHLAHKFKELGHHLEPEVARKFAPGFTHIHNKTQKSSAHG